MNRLSLPTGIKINECFFQLYTVNTNTNDDEMSWKNKISVTKLENSVVKYTFFLSTNEKHSPHETS